MGRNCRPVAMATSTPGAVQREEDEVGLGHRLHPGARDRDDLAGEVEPVVADRDGGEGPAPGLPAPAPHGSPRRCSSSATSSAACCCSSGLQLGQAAQ